MRIKKKATRSPKAKKSPKTFKGKVKPAVKKQAKKKAFPISISTIPEQRIEESKYIPSLSPVIQKFEQEKGFEFPQGYNDNQIVLMIRDPYWLYSYWELNNKRIDEIKNELGNKFSRAALILRVYDASKWNFFDINIYGYTGNWHINVGRPNTSFLVDIGFLTPDGYFICAARSNIVVTPRDRMSEVIDEEWMIPDWERMYKLSGGHAPSSWITSSLRRRL
ncbi:DUF4912 domain-containing protein [Candidatus Saganbacteria bacterium]|nr:DUF4912 domain-containing protein [Candidatus Saganbacteria bacterium]